MATYDQILNSYAVVILDLLPAKTLINSKNVADLLPKIKNAIKKFIHDNDVATTAEEFGININQNLDDPSDYKVTRDDILSSYRTTILMLASQQVKEAIDYFNRFIDDTIVRVSADPENEMTNLENIRTGSSSSIRTQILNKLVERAQTLTGGRSRSNKRSNKRSVYRRRRSSKRQSRKVSKARSSRRK